MVTVLTKFIAKDNASTTVLDAIFQELIQETTLEKGFISYEIFVVKDIPTTYLIFEKWESHEDLQNHAMTVVKKGYADQVDALLENEIKNIILQPI
jgi:quinol monooxygenase YgiN